MAEVLPSGSRREVRLKIVERNIQFIFVREPDEKYPGVGVKFQIMAAAKLFTASVGELSGGLTGSR